ncbi:MAG: hypothetical protein HGA45_21725 [Chloroflexales bacterium]|nr:hypothetical protein [Chloroflexales bacterium]
MRTRHTVLLILVCLMFTALSSVPSVTSFAVSAPPSPSQAGQITALNLTYLPMVSNATPPPATTPTPTPGTGQYFRTLPPGSQLPSDAACAAAVKRRAENKGVNATFNATRGSQQIGSSFTHFGSRVTGNFTGTTDEILQWAACKWGIDEDMVRAQAAVESWWRQDTLGDWTSDAGQCAPGRGLGVDGEPGQCPESFGILQNRYPYEQTAWPGIANSTAFNADVGYAIWRGCYEGYETWLNDVERGQTYAAGDEWGCFGRWFAGRWYTQPAQDYITRVRQYLDDRIWEQSSFQEP